MDREKTGRMARNKGANAERELARLIRDTWGYETRRGRVFDHQSDVVGLPGIHMEVKRVETLNIEKAIEQAEQEAQIRCDGLPVVFYRKNYGKWKVAMRLDTLLALLRASVKWCEWPQVIGMGLEEFMEIYGEWEAG